MKSAKRIGIWMDHSVAHLVEYTDDQTSTKTIYAQVGEQDEPLNPRDETMIQNKKQNQLSNYYKRLSEALINYEDVVLFGPTSAKEELINLIKADHHFDKIRFAIKTTDSMTENQRFAFIDAHFNPSKNRQGEVN